jgi:hypothetical protein
MSAHSFPESNVIKVASKFSAVKSMIEDLTDAVRFPEEKGLTYGPGGI